MHYYNFTDFELAVGRIVPVLKQATALEGEGYTLTVTENAIDIAGYGERGLLYGVITLMRCCEDTKETFVTEAMTMRQHSIFLQLYEDIADWCEKNPGEKLDLLNMRHVLSQRSWWLR